MKTEDKSHLYDTERLGAPLYRCASDSNTTMVCPASQVSGEIQCIWVLCKYMNFEEKAKVLGRPLRKSVLVWVGLATSLEEPLPPCTDIGQEPLAVKKILIPLV